MASSTQAVTINPDVFDPAAIPPSATAFNEKLMAMTKTFPKWWTVGAPKYRAMRDAGQAVFPAPVKLASVTEIQIPSRDPGRTIMLSIHRPPGSPGPPKGVYMHIHGGGWVLGHARAQDAYLASLTSRTGLLAVSVEYRLAPESPFPAAAHDCCDAAVWLVEHAAREFGAALRFVGGESAGAHLSALVAARLLEMGKGDGVRGLVLNYGVFDVGGTPSVGNFRASDTLVLDAEAVGHFREAFLPGVTGDGLRDAGVSPLYVDWGQYRGRLPAALFVCGTEDCLLDDTVFMSAKWMMAGGVADVVVVPGAFHGFSMITMEGAQADVAAGALERFVGRYV